MEWIDWARVILRPFDRVVRWKMPLGIILVVAAWLTVFIAMAPAWSGDRTMSAFDLAFAAYYFVTSFLIFRVIWRRPAY